MSNEEEDTCVSTTSCRVTPPLGARGERERERPAERERERGRERALLGTFHNGGSRASPAHGLGINILTGLLDSFASIRGGIVWSKDLPDVRLRANARGPGHFCCSLLLQFVINYKINKKHPSKTERFLQASASPRRKLYSVDNFEWALYRGQS